MNPYNNNIVETKRKYGEIELIIGPMYSGKSSRLLVLADRYERAKHRVLCLNHSSDKRYSNNNEIISHNMTKRDCIKTDTIKSIEYLISKYDVICVDEGQFFQDIILCDEYASKYPTKWIIAALDGDINKKPFKTIMQLIPCSNSCKKYSAVCPDCGVDAPFTTKINAPVLKGFNIELSSNEDTVKDDVFIQVGGVETYKAVCRACHDKFSIVIDKNEK